MPSATSSLPSHLWLEGGQLAVAHAGILEEMIGREAEAFASSAFTVIPTVRRTRLVS